jgi:hypothetical protein
MGVRDALKEFSPYVDQRSLSLSRAGPGYHSSKDDPVSPDHLQVDHIARFVSIHRSLLHRTRIETGGVPHSSESGLLQISDNLFGRDELGGLLGGLSRQRTESLMVERQG